MMNLSGIKEHMPVVGSDGQQVGTVDRVEGNAIKLTKDAQGQHHWIPETWISHVDDKVHLNATAQHITQVWETHPPQAAGARPGEQPGRS